MLTKKTLFILTMAVVAAVGTDAYGVSEEAEEGRRRDEKKKYLSEIEHGDKRYVGEAQKEDIEGRRRRGVEKRYVGDETDEEFFKEEKEALYKYDSVKEESEPEKMKEARLAIEEDPQKMEELKEDVKRVNIDVPGVNQE